MKESSTEKQLNNDLRRLERVAMINDIKKKQAHEKNIKKAVAAEQAYLKKIEADEQYKLTAKQQILEKDQKYNERKYENYRNRQNIYSSDSPSK